MYTLMLRTVACLGLRLRNFKCQNSKHFMFKMMKPIDINHANLTRNPVQTVLTRTIFASGIAMGLHLPLVKCQDENEKRHQFKLPEPVDLSPKQVLQQSSAIAVASTVQLLQLTTAAVLNASTSYRDAMAAEMLLLNRSLEFVNVEFMQREFNDTLIALRAEIQQAHSDLQELLGFMEYVDKLASAAAETSFLVGAEYSSFSLSDILFSAQTQIAEQKVKTLDMETELRGLQQQLVLKSSKKKVKHEELEPTEESSES